MSGPHKRRQAHARRSTEAPRDLSTYDGTHLVGRVVFVGDEWRAEGAGGESLGLFPTQREAREAISEQGRAGR